MSSRVRQHFFWVLIFALGVIVITFGIEYAVDAPFGSAAPRYSGLYPGVAISIVGLAISILAYQQINRGSIMQLKLIVFFDALIALSFLVFNIPLWRDGFYMYMDPFRITLYGPYFGLPTVLPNLLFWLFWLFTAVNVYYIFRVRSSKETKSNAQSLIPIQEVTGKEKKEISKKDEIADENQLMKTLD